MISLYNEDCLKGMDRISDKSVDMILCDLPYGCLNKKSSSKVWDNIIPYEPLWEQYKRIIKENGAIVLFSSGLFTAQLIMSNPNWYKYNLVWDKVDRTTGFLDANRKPLRIHEDICVFYRKTPTYNPQKEKRNVLVKIKENTGNNCYGETKGKGRPHISDSRYPTSILRFKKDVQVYHPTQKPVALLQWLIRTFTNEGELVLDNCMGSGSTGVACVKENRSFIGFELMGKYFDIAKERITIEQNQLKLF